jgi:hypothetical protein
MFAWIWDHQVLLWTATAASVALFIASMFIMPAIIVRIRADYFAHEKRPASAWVIESSTLRVAVRIGKNVLGALLMIIGVAMWVLPGPGTLTVLMGFLLIDFPHKYRFERWLVSRSVVRRPLNWMRHRAGRVPLVVYSG